MYSRLSPEMHCRMSEIATLGVVQVQELRTALMRLNSALVRVQGVGSADASNLPNVEYDNYLLFFIALKDVAEAFSSVSRVFFPLKPRRMKYISIPETSDELKERIRISELRGRLLREFFEVTDSSPIANTLLRNRIVHMDEDFDLNFIRKNGQPVIRNLMAPIAKTVDGISNNSVVERFDRETSIYYVFGNSLNLDEVLEIKNKLNSEIDIIEKCLIGAIPKKE